jgi:ribosomal protein S18 acetylase RimI-like enzyme
VYIERLGEDDRARVQAASHLFDEPAQEEATGHFLSAHGHHLLLAFEDGRPIGFVTGVEMTHPDKGTEMFLYELGVDEGFRGQGVGTALVERLAELARDRRCYGMWVLTDLDNAAATATYVRAGARHEGDQAMFSWTF